MALAATSVCVALSWSQVGYWSGDIPLWEHAVAVTENNALAHLNLGVGYHEHRKFALAQKQYEETLALEPKNIRARHNLGIALWQQQRHGEAQSEFLQVIELEPDHVYAHYNLGNVYRDQGWNGQAEAAYRRAVELAPAMAHAHHNLGVVLESDGRLDEALVELERAVELGDLNAERRRAQCEQFADLRKHLPAVIRGDEQVTGARAALNYAWLCVQPFERRYALAARMFTVAFAADPRLLEARQPSLRYYAAASAARAGCGQGEDASALGVPEQARLRTQALGWFRAELATLLVAAASPPQNREHEFAVRTLRYWQDNADLDGVRSAEALGKLEQPEREAWQKLWSDVAGALPAPGASR